MHIYNGAWWIGGAGAAGVSLYILVWVLGVSLGLIITMHLIASMHRMTREPPHQNGVDLAACTACEPCAHAHVHVLCTYMNVYMEMYYMDMYMYYVVHVQHVRGHVHVHVHVRACTCTRTCLT